MAADNRRLYRIFSWLGVVIATLIVLFAIMITIGRLLIPYLNSEKPYFEHWLSHSFGVPVKIEQIDGHWSWFDPILKFNHVTVEDKTGQYTVIRVDQIQVGIDLFYSVFKWQLLPGRLAIIGTKLTMYEDQQGHVQVQGIVGQDQQHSTAFLDLANWLATQAEIILDKVSLTWRDSSGTIIPVKDLMVRIRNRDQHHLQALLTLDQAVPSQLKIIANFEAINFANWQFTGQLYVQAQQVLLSQWAKLQAVQPYLQNIQIQSGDCSGQLWATWTAGELSKIQTRLNTNHLKVHWIKSDKTISATQLSGNVLWHKVSHGWQLIANQMHTRLNNMDWPANAYEVQYTYQPNATVALKIAYMPVSLLADFSQALTVWPANDLALYKKLSPKATLYNLTLSRQWVANKSADYKVSTDFVDLSVLPTADYPSVTHLNGHVDVTPTAGEMKLVSEKGSVTVPNAFSHAVGYDHLQAIIHWQKENHGWQVSGDHFHLFDQRANILGQFRMWYSPGSEPYFDMLAGFNFKDSQYIGAYLPDRKLKPKVVNWVAHGFPKGIAKQGVMVLRGPAQSFPYQHHEGQFQVGFDVENLTMHYHEGWPDISNILGYTEFDDDSLQVIIHTAQALGNPLTNIQASIPNMKQAVLTVSGQSATDMNQGLNFLQQTPLKFARQLKILQLKGPAELAISLTLPIDKALLLPLKVTGQLNANGVDLQIPAWHLSMQKIQGPVKFTENAVSADKLTGTMFSAPVTATISTYKPGEKTSFLNVNLQGKVDAADIQQQFKIPEYKHLSGQSTVEANLRIPSDETQPTELTLLSDFRGMRLDLPYPLAKQADVAMPTNIHFDMPTQNAPLEIFIRYGQQLTAAFMAQKEKEGLHLTSGEIHLGKGSAAQQKLPGLLITGQLAEFDWNQWADLLKQLSSPQVTATKEPPLKLRLVHLNIDKIIYNDFRLSNMDLRLQLSEYGYTLNVDSPNVTGGIRIPKDLSKYKITAKLSRFYWPKSAPGTTLPRTDGSLNVSTILPQSIPGLEIHCDNVRWGDHDYGLVDLITTSNSQGMVIDKLLIGDKNYSVNIAGNWSSSHGVQNTQLTGKIASGSFGSLLSGWDVTHMLAESRGEIDFKFYWNDSLLNFVGKKLGGSLSLNIRSGRILELGQKTESELGLGKLLSLLSLQELPRRLMLNFSDVTKKGFSFDIMKGDFSIVNGRASTSDMYLNGPIAKVLLNGSIDVGYQTFDLTLDVRPYLTSTLPLVATVAGGPIAGFVTWMANKIVGPTIGRVARVVVRVTGPWGKPNILKLSEVKGKQPKYSRHYN